MSTPTIEDLRVQIRNARRELTLSEGKAEARAGELAALEKQASDLGIAPDQLSVEAHHIRGDVNAAVKEV